jgi:hypothetical protein
MTAGECDVNRYEKFAWFTLAVENISLIAYGIIFMLLVGKSGAAKASFVALSSFSLLSLIGFAPQLFKRQDLSREVSIKREKFARLSYQKIITAAILFCIFIACVVLFTSLLRVPAGNDALQLVATVMKIIISFFLIFFVVMVFLYMKKQHPFSYTSENVDAWYGFGLLGFSGSDMDERDSAIQRSASLFVFRVFWIVYVFGFLVAWLWMVIRGWKTVTIDIHLIPALIIVPVLAIRMINSIATILLYRRGN